MMVLQLSLGCTLLTLGCAGGPSGAPVQTSEAPSSPPAVGAKSDTGLAGRRGAAAQQTQDSSDEELIPAGFGSMRQDALSLHVDGPGVLVRALPLDESVIRLMTPD